jgi:2-polyprenyl-6-methoxyphenol hydroxylase-like FAD-dependent oxidoreductase
VAGVDGTAVVIGASMAGLVTARVLSRRYANVTVLDRDELPAGDTPRRGVPQGAQPHVLLVSGLRELSGLFPGLGDELVERGGVRFDPGLGLCVHRYGNRWPRAATGLELVSMSRPLLESVVRDRVAKEPGVTIRDRVCVTALSGSDSTVTGVFLDTGELLDADLVVDCSGRGSRSGRWLAGLGLARPEQVEIKIGVTYTARVHRRSPGELDGWHGALILPAAPDENRAGWVLAIDSDRWLVAVGGWHIDAPPGDAESFTTFAKSLPDPILAELIAGAEPLTDPVTYRFPSSRRRLFERLQRPPAGYVTLGDAICSFNPIYGQGMSCAAMEAGALDRALAQHGAATAEMARDYYAATARIIATPWRFAVGGDFAHPATTGPRPRGIALSNWYARKIAIASQRDADINRVFMAVQQLVAPASELFRPGLAAKALWRARGADTPVSAAPGR